MVSLHHDSFRRFFAGLSPHTIDTLCRNAVLEFVPAKTLLFEKDALANSLLILGEGLVQIFRADSEGETTVLIIKPPASLNTAFALSNIRPPVSARAIVQSFVLRIPLLSIRRMFESDTDFRQLIIGDLTSTQNAILQELLSLRTQTALERLTAWVFAIYREADYASAIDLPYGKSLLAARLGMAPETLSRNLALLESLGVSVRDRTLHITNVEKFRSLADAGEENPSLTL